MFGAIACGLLAIAVASTSLVVYGRESELLRLTHHRAAEIEARLHLLAQLIEVDARTAFIFGDESRDLLLGEHMEALANDLAIIAEMKLAPNAFSVYQSSFEQVTNDYERARIQRQCGYFDDAREAVASAEHGARFDCVVAAQDTFWAAVDEELDERGEQSDSRVYESVACSVALMVTSLIFLNRALSRYRKETSAAVSSIEASARAELQGVVRSSTHFVQTMIDASLDAFILISSDGVVRDWNRRAEELFLFSATEAIGRPLSELIIPESDRPAHFAALARYCTGVISRVVGQRIELAAIRKDGSGLPVELSVVPISRDGETYFAGFVRDVTDRRRWEDAIRTNEQRLRLALQGAGIGMWDWDLITDRTHFNEQWYTMLGFEYSELPMTLATWEHLCHPDDIAKARREIRRHLDGDAPRYRCELRMRCKDGSYKWILDLGEVSLRDPSGKPIRVTGVHINIDDLRRTEADRRRIETILQVAIDHLPARVFWKDPESNYLGCSKSFALDAGATDPIELIGRSDHDLVWRAHAERFQSDDRAVMESRNSRLNFEEPIDGPDGSPRWLRTNKIPLCDDAGTVIGVIGTYEDVTEERNAKIRMSEALEAARAASRAKSEFLANMSHEIRTPMNAILGFAELLNEEVEHAGNPRVREFVTTIGRNANHLLAIINDILDLSKLEAGKMKVECIELQPSAIVMEVVELMRARADGKAVGLHCEFLTPIPRRIESDPVRLRQILMNLLGNAIKFTEIGSVRVSVSMARRLDGSSALSIAIRDTGIGIEPSQIGRLFDAFEQADSSMSRRFGGTGLGLQISQRLAGMLGGEIRVESQIGVGSVFTLTLDVTNQADGELEKPLDVAPRSTNEAAPANPGTPVDARPCTSGAQPCAPLAAGELAGLRILLAEDGPDNQRLLSFHLRRAGADVTLADNGKIAVELLCRDAGVGGELIEPRPFDLILMDMQMPEMDGYAATAILRSKGYRGPIVALTAHAMEDDAHRCLEAGCDVHATKPISKGDLIALCRANLTSTRLTAADVSRA